MGLDIRWPIGLMFSLIGAMLVIYGLATGSNSGMYQRSMGDNVNLYWGLLLFVFGAAMLAMAWRGARQARNEPGNANAEGASDAPAANGRK